MATSDGWYLIGPLLAVGLLGFLGIVFWRLGLQWVERADDPLYQLHGRELYGLSIFTDPEPDDYGLLRPAAVCDEPDTAEEIRHLLVESGIRATQAMRCDGRVCVLVFAEELDEARRLVGT